MTEAAYITDLVHRAQRGEEQALNTLLAVVRPRLYAYALRICKFNVVAEDALQDAFLHAYLHFYQLRNSEAFFPWLRTIVKRSAWNAMKNSSRSIPIEGVLSEPALEYEIESGIEQTLLTSAIYDRINALSETLRTTLMLRYFSSKNEYSDIATILDVPVGTVRSRLNEAKRQLSLQWKKSPKIDLPDQLRSQSEQWNEFYREHWGLVYDSPTVRHNFFSHFSTDLTVNFTSGKSNKGRVFLEQEIDDDLYFGSRFKVESVFNLGDLGVIEGIAINSKEYPDRCPPSMTMIVKRDQDRAVMVNIHNSV